MAQPDTASIHFSENLMVSEKRTAVLSILQATGQLTYWGMREGCYLVVFAERPGKLEALTGADVDRLEFDNFVQLAGQTVTAHGTPHGIRIHTERR